MGSDRDLFIGCAAWLAMLAVGVVVIWIALRYALGVFQSLGGPL